MEQKENGMWKELYYSVLGKPITGDIYDLQGLSAFCLWLSGTDLKKQARDLYYDLRRKNILPYSRRTWYIMQDAEKVRLCGYKDIRDLSNIYRWVSEVLPTKK